MATATFNWERDAVGFYSTWHTQIAAAAILYYPVIFGIRWALRDKQPFDLGGEKSKCMVNWIFWWELALAIFSIAGAYNVVPLVLHSLSTSSSLTDAICGQRHYDHPASWWIFVFNVSKVFEFGDTLLVVLRKKPLILLQHYHHLATMLYCWWGTITVFRYNNTNPFFAGMNLCVHSIMYTWYAATRTGWRSPKLLMMLVTLVQLVQMVLGFGIVVVAQGDDPACVWAAADPWGARAATFMYASYFVLFAKLFFDNYLAPKKSKSARAKTA